MLFLKNAYFFDLSTTVSMFLFTNYLTPSSELSPPSGARLTCPTFWFGDNKPNVLVILE